jgi:hypothetical protein
VLDATEPLPEDGDEALALEAQRMPRGPRVALDRL